MNLPLRIENILAMEDLPDFVEYSTWNDGPEAHYIGNLWVEQNNDSQPWAYANQELWPHQGWQPLVSSFIDAFKNNILPGAMEPQSDEVAVGAAWYHTIQPYTVICPYDGAGLYYDKPSGFSNGSNSLYYMVVADTGIASGWKIHITTGTTTKTVSLNGGINFGYSDGDVAVGAQLIQVTDASGAVKYSATGGMCVSSGCPNLIYNMNYQVLPLIAGDTAATCTDWADVEWDNVDVDEGGDLGGDDSYPTCYDGDNYSTIDDVAADSSIDDDCLNIYLLSALSTTFSQALQDYSDLMSDGYVDKFKTYMSQVQSEAPWQYAQFLAYGGGEDLFSCLWEIPGDDGVKTNRSGDCPTDASAPSWAWTKDYDCYWVVNDETAWNDGLQKYGIDTSWAVPTSTQGQYCVEGGKAGLLCSDAGTWWQYEVSDDVNVPDPSDYISKSLSSLTSLQEWLSEAADFAPSQMFFGSNSDAVAAASVPVFMTQSAVESMQEVADVSDDSDHESVSEQVLNFLSAFLLVVPILGEFTSVVAEAEIYDSIATMASIAGDIGITLYQVAEDPSSAPAAITGLLLEGAVGLRNDDDWSTASSYRRAMSDTDIAALGTSFEKSMTKLASTKNLCGI